MELYLIRHGQSANNALDLDDNYPYSRGVDPSLTDLGKQQAEHLARYLTQGVDLETLVTMPLTNRPELPHGFGITRIYASPMLRSLQTAQPLAKALGIPVEVWVELHEHGGMFLRYPDERGVVGFPGRSRAEILADFPDYLLPPSITEEGWWNPTSKEEDLAGCYARAVRVSQVMREFADSQEQIALVTHGTFTDCLVKAFLNMLPSNNLHFSHYNTGVSRLEFRPKGEVIVRYVNRVNHLPSEMVT